MASLTQTSISARKAIRYFIYFVVIVIIIRISYSVVTYLYERFKPNPTPPPTLEFGNLPKLPFPDTNNDSYNNLSYELDILDESTKIFPGQVDVFFMPKTASGIQVLDQGKGKAQRLGFSPDGIELVETVYRFQAINKPASLTLNLVTGEFSIAYDYQLSPQVFSTPPIVDAAAVTRIKEYLTNAGTLPADIRQGATSQEYLAVSQGTLVPVASLSQANAVKVNLFRKAPESTTKAAATPGEEPPSAESKETLPTVTETFNEANIWFVLANNTGEIIRGEYKYFPIEAGTSGTYPIKTFDEAWEEFRNGKGYLANPGSFQKGETVFITKTYLAYYDPGKYYEFFQPVIVFEADNGFAGYVPAVSNEYYDKENQEGE